MNFSQFLTQIKEAKSKAVVWALLCFILRVFEFFPLFNTPLSLFNVCVCVCVWVCVCVCVCVFVTQYILHAPFGLIWHHVLFIGRSVDPLYSCLVHVSGVRVQGSLLQLH